MARQLARLQRASYIARGTGTPITTIDGGTPDGWSVWGSDGRIVPTPGLYRITASPGSEISIRKPGGAWEGVASPWLGELEDQNAIYRPGDGGILEITPL